MSKQKQPAVLSCAAFFAVLVFAPALWAQPAFSKAFSPATIGPGSTSTLTFTIDNTGGGIVSDLAFVDTLPAGVMISDRDGDKLHLRRNASRLLREGQRSSLQRGTLAAGGVLHGQGGCHLQRRRYPFECFGRSYVVGRKQRARELGSDSQ